MEIKVRPIKNQQTGLTKIFAELVLKELPIHEWCKKQELLRNGK